MPVVAKKKPAPSGNEEKKQRRHGVPLQMYLPAWVKEALESLAQDGRRPLTSECMIALEAHLKAAGRWNPPKDAAK